MILFHGTKYKIRFIYVGFNCKRKKKWIEICAIKGGGFRRLLVNAILNFHLFGILS